MKNTHTYREIATEFDRQKFHHRQVKRSGMIALYERWSTEVPNPSHHFEVVRIRNSNEHVIAGVTIPAAEVYPHSESWGTNGFTYGTRQEAEAKFADLTAE